MDGSTSKFCLDPQIAARNRWATHAGAPRPPRAARPRTTRTPNRVVRLVAVTATVAGFGTLVLLGPLAWASPEPVTVLAPAAGVPSPAPAPDVAVGGSGHVLVE